MFEIYCPQRGRMKKLTRQQKESLPHRDLIRLAQKNDSQAVEILLTRFKNFARKKALVRVYSLPGADTDDLEQSAMIALYNAIMSYDPNKGSFVSYATMCIQAKSIEALHFHSRKKHQVLTDAMSLQETIYGDEEKQRIETIPYKGVDPLEVIILKEDVNEVLRLVDKHFSDMESRVLACRVNGLSYGETSTLLRITEKSVDNAVSRIRTKAERLRLKRAI